jgi:hypothetical protein
VKKVITSLVFVVVMGAVVLMTVGTAAAKPPAANGPSNGKVCPEEGKVELGEDVYQITGLAPGTYCVKAGSAKQGGLNGAVTVEVVDGTLSHPSGKAISHYSPLSVTEPGGDPGDCPDDVDPDTPGCQPPS